MSDRFYSSVKVGGNLKRDDVQEFLQAIQDQAAFNSDESMNSTEATTLEDLERFKKNGHLFFQDCEASGGYLSEIRDVCERLGLSFDHHNDSYHDWGAGNEFCRDGDIVGFIDSNNDGVNMVSVPNIQSKFGERLEKIASTEPHEIRRVLMELCKMNLKPLPEFKVVG